VLYAESTAISKRLRIATFLFLLTLLAGVWFEYYEIESIVASGPILALVGILICFLAYRERDRSGILLGSSAISLCVLVFLLIFLNRWSPEQATKPVTVVSWVYTAMASPFAVYLGCRRQQAEVAEQTE
jgi:hypothetical protein